VNKQMATLTYSGKFYGWRVVGAAFVLAVFGWGLGFYGPPIYLQAVRDSRGWSLPLVSAAVTVHFLFGALVVASLPRLYLRYGLPAVTKAGVLSLAVGISGWAIAAEPWQLFAAALFSGAGWVAMGAAAVNAILAPWFVRTRPAALAMAYNGASIGGVVFSPLWVAAIGLWGFPAAAAVVGVIVTICVFILADGYFSRTPQQMGLAPDGDHPGVAAVSTTSAAARSLLGASLWKDRGFVTLALGTALGLFAQIGLLAHLFSLLVPAVGAPLAGIAISAATIAAIAGRTLVGWLMPVGADRRLVACGSLAVQIAGSIAFLIAGGAHIPLLVLGIILFGVGIGNATSLPPLIAQAEFAREDVSRVVALNVAISQGTYAFAPASFGLIREFAPQAGVMAAAAAPYLFAAAALIQAAAVAAFLAGRRNDDRKKGSGRTNRARPLPISGIFR
jgi:Major Facilitator Superfamily